MEFLEFCKSITPHVTIVRGEYDPPKIRLGMDPQAPEQEVPMNAVVKQGGFKIGCCSGYTVIPKNDPLSLLTLARQLDVDIMLWGGTHNVEAYTLEGKFFVNPGSCTGAFNTDWHATSEPSVQAGDHQIEDTQKDSAKDEQEGKKEEEEGDKEETQSLSEGDVSISDMDVTGSNVPSFCLLDIQGNTCTLYIYMYVDDEVKVDKVVYQKPRQEDH